MPYAPHYKNLPDKTCDTCLYQVVKSNSIQGMIALYCLLNPPKKLKVCSQHKPGKGLRFHNYKDLSLSEYISKEKNKDRLAIFNLAPEILQRAYDYAGNN